MFAEIASVLLPIVGSILGEGAAAGDRRTAEEMAKLPLEFIQNMSIPEREQLVAHLQRFTSAGKLDPRLEAAITLGPSATAGVGSDPRLVAQQQANLEQLQAIADAGGYDPTVKADLAAALRKQEQSVKANQEALAMQAQARGMQSAGATQALQQMASQSEANRMSDIQERLAAQAYQNRLNALAGASAETGRLRTSDLTEKEMRARAVDTVNEFNARMQESQGQRNISRLNTAEERNLAAAQELLNKNVGVGQAEEESRIQSYKDYLDMQARKAGYLSGAASTAGQSAAARAERTAGQIRGVAEAGAGGLSSYMKNVPETPTSSTGSVGPKGSSYLVP